MVVAAGSKWTSLNKSGWGGEGGRSMVPSWLVVIWAPPVNRQNDKKTWLKTLPFHKIHMSHFAYACKMWCPLNLVLEKSEYLWFYWTFCIVILDYGLKLHKLSNHTLIMLQKWLEIHLIIVWSLNCVLFFAIFATETFQKKMSTLSLKLNYWSPRHQTAVFKVLISFKCS